MSKETLEKIYWVPFEQMEAFMFDCFVGSGVPKQDAKVCADVLIAADKHGIDSHGIGRLKPIYIDRIADGIQNPVTNFEIVKETETTAVIDGHDGMGHVISVRSMNMAIEKAKKYGLGMVAVRNSTHYGISGYYAQMAIDNGQIGITGTNARPSIAPTFGIENMLGTNPLVFGFPTDEDFPFIIDCATSVTQRGKIELYQRQGKTMPEGWVIGSDGKTRTDPAQTLKDLIAGTAALTPLGGLGEETGGYKGYSYATVVEVLSAALQDGSYLKGLLGYEDGKKVPYRLGHFFLAINIEHFIPLPVFKSVAGNIMRGLRNSAKAPGQERIWTAGEKEHYAWLERKDKGVPVGPALQKDCNAMRAAMGLNHHIFPWDNQ
ncbi:MAG: Ldh family oxidoreductase [Myxococcota bacterium]|jgi:L-2-hydroxycarboxylate dehydrogenase (NAD+)|nr:Ldh family oxidoreductase [Myxococcota bacterium]HOS62795.1 Ldh family oxidoreductase [Myxococcota bacterium]HPC92667.1 Ldh family oxidoreductase [Myxococcota bacterium]HPL25982.1 Ldh family oxidoreductase [Myxococcota bacterium]HQC45440.1 Ldh family oxidoreductase [Myxococcota bacterium]